MARRPCRAGGVKAVLLAPRDRQARARKYLERECCGRGRKSEGAGANTPAAAAKCALPWMFRAGLGREGAGAGEQYTGAGGKFRSAVPSAQSLELVLPRHTPPPLAYSKDANRLPAGSRPPDLLAPAAVLARLRAGQFRLPSAPAALYVAAHLVVEFLFDVWRDFVGRRQAWLIAVAANRARRTVVTRGCSAHSAARCRQHAARGRNYWLSGGFCAVPSLTPKR